MRVNFLYSLIYILMITMLISGIIPAMVAADDDESSWNEGNSTILLPDLIIENPSWSPETPETGEEVTIRATVKNQGNAGSGATNLAFYGDGNKIGERPVPEIEAGDSIEISFSLRPETERTMEISAKVDEENSVTESNENNNFIIVGSISFKSARLPDLVIDTLECSANPMPGKFQNIYITVKNQGTATSEETELALYIDGRAITDWRVPRLSQGEKSYALYPWWIPLREGPAEIKAVVDKNNLVRESDQGNNERIITVIVAEERLPDLIIEDIVPESAEAEEGKLLNLTLKVKNQGIAPSEEVRAKYYINGTSPTQDEIRVPALAEGTGADVIFSLVPDREGQMEVSVFIDSGTDVYESDESNNQFTKIIDVKTILPDLMIESISLNPEAPRIGDNITFTVSVKNIGLRDSASSEMKYYISGTNVTHSGEIPVPAIPAGEVTRGIFYWIPEEEGNIEVRLVADSGDAIREEDETNNGLTRIVSISRQTPGIEQPAPGSGLSSGSGSSSSSMGSGVSKEPARNVKAKELSTRNIISGYHVKYDFMQNATCITYIEFDPVKTFKRTTATVEVLKEKSIFVQKEPPGRIYRQINIWVGNKGAGLPASIKDGHTGFKVEKAWMKENSVNESNITLLWYDSNWKPLSTEKAGEDGEYVHFKTKTPGYSLFAISEYAGEEGTVEEFVDQEEIQQTLRSLEDGGKTVLSSSAERDDGIEKKPMGVAKILIAISLPLFMILVEYFVLRKKI